MSVAHLSSSDHLYRAHLPHCHFNKPAVRISSFDVDIVFPYCAYSIISIKYCADGIISYECCPCRRDSGTFVSISYLCQMRIYHYGNYPTDDIMINWTGLIESITILSLGGIGWSSIGVHQNAPDSPESCREYFAETTISTF